MSLALTSAAFLAIPFLWLKLFWLAWIALVPWLLLLRNIASPRAAFGWSWLIGFLFFLGSMWWLIHVTVVGWLILCAYLALFFGLFGLLARSLFTTHYPLPTTHYFLIPSAWVVLEYLRSHVLSGLGWNLLAYSQTSWRELIQIADLTGVWGVSFLIVLVNTALTALLQDARRVTPALVAGVAMALTVAYGLWRIPQLTASQRVRIAVVQGNIPQEEKWDEAFQTTILSRYESLTRPLAAAQPALIVWPETSVPGYLGIDETLTQRVMNVAKRLKRPLLVGAPVPVMRNGMPSLRNSAILMDDTGAFLERYDKLHLVPFGEFVPWERTVPWLRRLLPPIGEFSPGEEAMVFNIRMSNDDFRMSNFNSQFAIRNSTLSFSVLICFEDIFPELARRFVREGARMLVVMTNDAWFGPTAAAYQHAQASTFRAVELRVPVVRAANTGWSGCIDPSGRWMGAVRDASGKVLFVEGTHVCDLPLATAHSLYGRWGDWVPTLCVFIVIGGVLRKGTGIF